MDVKCCKMSLGRNYIYWVIAMGQKKIFDSDNEELHKVIQQLGDLRDLQLEKYISEVINRPNAILLANQILEYLADMNEENSRISERMEEKNAQKIMQLTNELIKSNLSPMEKRFIFIEIAHLIRDMKSLSRYWLQKPLTGMKYIGAVGTIIAAAVFYRKRK